MHASCSRSIDSRKEEATLISLGGGGGILLRGIPCIKIHLPLAHAPLYYRLKCRDLLRRCKNACYSKKLRSRL